MRAGTRRRPVIGFFDCPDVFEDFYPHYDVGQREFATTWAATGNHAFLSALQQHVGDVVWYVTSVRPERDIDAVHDLGFRVRYVASSAAHRALWSWFYTRPTSWRWQQRYRAYATPATYLAVASRELYRAMREDAPDAYFVQDYANGKFDTLVASGRITRRPVVAYHSGSLPSGYVARWPKRFTIPWADLLLVPGQRERQRLIDEQGARPDRVRRLLTPIDTATFRPRDRASACAAAGLDPDRRYLLFLGRLDDRIKRIGALINTFTSIAGDHPDTDLVIAGDGPDNDKLRAHAEQAAPGRVHFTGWVDDPAVKAALCCASTALVLPSRSEGFPTVVGEALACGTPVVASDVGAVSELVRPGETGWLVPPGDNDALARALREALTTGPAMAAAARRMAEAELSPEAIGSLLAAYFSELLPPGRQPAKASSSSEPRTAR